MGSISKTDGKSGNTSQPNGDADRAASPGADTRTASARASARNRAGTDRRNSASRAAVETKPQGSPETSLGIETEIKESKPPRDSVRAFSQAETAPEKPKKPRKAKAVAPTADEAAMAVHGLIEIVQTFTIARFGPDAAFNAVELSLIEPSLARLFERYGSVANQFGWLLDPMLVAAGLGLYALRIGPQIRQQTEPKESPLPPEPRYVPVDDNGGTPPGFSPDELNALFGGFHDPRK
jgi:hypothetical protein